MLAKPQLRRLGQMLGDKAANGRGLDSKRTRAARRAQGAYFTPPALVDIVAEEVIGARLRAAEPSWRADGSPELTVLDPAAGDGRFLSAAVRVLSDHAVSRGHDRERAHAAIASRCIIAIERDDEFARKIAMSLPGADIVCAEALASPRAAGIRADIVLGNPPYIRSIHLGESDEQLRQALRGRYQATSHGEWDLYSAFLEHSLEWVKPGGQIGLVVPSRWLTARAAARLRRHLAEQAAVRGLILFGAEQIFAGATTYASVVFLSASRNRTVSIARFERGTWHTGSVPTGELDDKPWRLSVGARRSIVKRLERCTPLGAVARIAKGTGTNADSVYVMSREQAEAIEPELVRLCLRGRDITGYGSADTGTRCLVPYRPEGTLIEPEDMAARYPRALAYLESHRALLDGRERGRFRGPRFYQFGRPQNLALLLSAAPRIAVPDVARDGRALLDRTGALLLDSAYAVVPSRSELLPLVLAVLNSGIVRLWLGETGLPLRGGYLRLKTAYLESLPLPDWTAPAVRQAARLADTPDTSGQAAAIDELLREAYGIGREHWPTLQ